MNAGYEDLAMNLMQRARRKEQQQMTGGLLGGLLGGTVMKNKSIRGRWTSGRGGMTSL